MEGASEGSGGGGAVRPGPSGQVDPRGSALLGSPLALVLLRPTAEGAEFVCAEVSPAAERVLGRPRQALVGRRAVDLLGGATGRCAEVWRSGQAQAVAGVRVDAGAEQRGVIARTGDALALVLAEEARAEQRAWLEEVTGELQVPLRAIAALCQAAEENCPEGRVLEFMTLIHACAASLLGSLGEALDLEALAAGPLTGAREPFAPRAAVAEALRPLAVLARTKEIALAIEVDEEVPEVLVGDRTRLRRVLASFVGEAIQRTGRGAVRVRVGRTGALLLHVIVEDPGPAEREGGVGHKIAERVVTRLGGRCWVAAEDGAGRALHFTLPVEPGHRDMVSCSCRKMRVLLAEDEPIHQVVAVHLLERAGHEVVVVDNGWRVLAAVAAGGFDAVLMDLEMPELDGTETLQILRANAEGPRVPVVALVTRATEAVRARCAAAGFDAVIAKPVDARGLAALAAVVTASG